MKYFFKKLPVKPKLNLPLEFAQRHLHCFCRAAVRKREACQTVRHLVIGYGEFPLIETNDRRIRPTLFQKEHCFFTRLKDRHTRNVKYGVSNAATDGGQSHN